MTLVYLVVLMVCVGRMAVALRGRPAPASAAAPVIEIRVSISAPDGVRVIAA